MIYDIYHDECKEDGYWHGFLFIPRDSRDELLELLHGARTNVGYFHRMHYVDIRKKTKPHHEKYILAEAWTSIGCTALQQHKSHKNPPIALLGRNPHKKTQVDYRILTQPLKCKFVLFRENDKHRNMYRGMSQLQRIETTFRMGIKGGVHSLFSESEPIKIGNVFMDGNEQYVGVYKRNFSIDRTLQRFAYEKRSFVSFVDGPMLIPQRSDHSLIEIGQDANDSHLLQLCDILIGGFRFHSCSGDREHPRFQISSQCKELLQHEQANRARMAQSRYYNGFSLQQTWLSDGEWGFSPLVVAAAPRAFQAGLFADGLDARQQAGPHSESRPRNL